MRKIWHQRFMYRLVQHVVCMEKNSNVLLMIGVALRVINVRFTF